MTKKPKPSVKFEGTDVFERAIDRLRDFQRDRKAALDCPNCGAPGLRIIDRSSRPTAEWYAFACKSCGLEDVVQIPLASHRPPS